MTRKLIADFDAQEGIFTEEMISELISRSNLAGMLGYTVEAIEIVLTEDQRFHITWQEHDPDRKPR